MLTFKRSDDLAEAVPAFLAEARSIDRVVQLLVVDNDPVASAREYVASVGDSRVRYVHEPRPGIAAGRNRALAESRGADLVVFVDDDESPRPGWLAALVDTHQRTGATVVAGAVVSDCHGELDEWMATGRFFERRRMPTGTAIDVAATNNLLLDLSQLPSSLVFDEEFSLSGGSDTLFTRTLHQRGRRMVWCDEAVVVDRVPADRVTRKWVLARARRSGNSAVRVEIALASDGLHRQAARATGFARGALRVVGGSGRVLLGRLTGTIVHDARGRRSVQRGLGMIGAAVGAVVMEYARPVAS